MQRIRQHQKKPVRICVACNCFCSWRKVKAESEAERLVTTSYKNIHSMLETTEKTGKKKHDKNEREDWRTVGELLINPLSFTQLAQSHGVCGFPAARSLADLQIFCWKGSCRLLEYKQTFFWCCRTSFCTLLPARMRYTSGLEKSGRIVAFCDWNAKFCDQKTWCSRNFAPKTGRPGASLRPDEHSSRPDSKNKN